MGQAFRCQCIQVRKYDIWIRIEMLRDLRHLQTLVLPASIVSAE
jgi:hypothetical protein